MSEDWYGWCRQMLASREPKKRTASWDELTLTWLAGLRDTIASRDPGARKALHKLAHPPKRALSSASSDPRAKVVAEAVEAAAAHLAAHAGVGGTEPSRSRSVAKSASGFSCKAGSRCREYAAALAIYALHEAISIGAENVCQLAGAIMTVRKEILRIAKAYGRTLKKSLPWMKARHAQHKKLLKQGWPTSEHEVLCRRPALVLEGLRHLHFQIAGIDEALMGYLPPSYRHPLGKKGHLSLLDLVTEPLLPSFRDKEIADLIPDGLGPNAVQRVSNRRFKRTGSRLQPEEFGELTLPGRPGPQTGRR